MLRIHLRLVAVIAVVVVLCLVGCEGGGGQGGQGGTVTGRVISIASQLGVGGAVITLGVGGPSATSDSNGNYTVTGVAGGSNIPVFVTPPAGFTVSDPTPGTPEVALVNVVAGATTILPDIVVVPTSPPQPP
jgi:hypothetical protein